MKKLFKLHAPFQASGSQPEAIKKLIEQRPGISTLMGITGSGKTLSIAHVIAEQDRPVLILSPNKTLAAQLYEEFSLFFPENKVCYFVSYYDYYLPESYLPAQDIYTPKEKKVNSEIERLRIETTASLVNRRDTIVIASVSAIYSLGNPTDYRDLAFPLVVGQSIKRIDLLRHLIALQYVRNDIDKKPGTMQVLGNIIEVTLPYQKERLRIEIFGDAIESMSWISKHDSSVLMNLDNVVIFPAKHFVTTEERKRIALRSIRAELEEVLPSMPNILYRERLKQRTEYDLEMIEQMGHCSGIENYSIHFDGRNPDQPPFCLFDFFPEDFLLIVDESHIAIPQLKGMHAGDASRKKALVDYGFRLPSAYHNRPLKFEETERFFRDVIFVSATPGDYELRHSNQIVEQIIRPTGLLDPTITIHGRPGQMDHLVEQIEKTTAAGFRSLVMVMTKQLAEELARYLEERRLKVCYLHSELKTPQRSLLLHKLRLGEFDCLVGVNLLREGIDLPEVALVAIMDADIESFLRDKRSLIQIIGRAARNTESRVLLYADKITQSMQAAIDETNRRRAIQEAHNKKYNITPKTVTRDVTKSISSLQEAIAAASKTSKKQKKDADKPTQPKDARDMPAYIAELEKRMQEAAEQLDFEKAIALREKLLKIRKEHQ